MGGKIKIYLSGLLPAAFVCALFQGCLKKADDDPGISFRTRKARVVGEWKMTSRSFKDTESGYTVSFVSNGSTYTADNQQGGVALGNISEEIILKRDGSYRHSMTIDGQLSISEGVWNFTGGVGEIKKKSQISLYEQKYTPSTGSGATWTGHYIDITYDLAELSNKKMRWSRVVQGNYTSGPYTYKRNYTWELK